jgi:hypothetical protein
MLAAIGLGTDNPVTIVASMLVSPIMNPVRGVILCVIACKTKHTHNHGIVFNRCGSLYNILGLGSYFGNSYPQ